MNEWTNKRTNEQCTRSYGIHKLYGITTFIQMEMEIHIHHRLHASAAFFLSLLSKLLLSFFNKIYNNNNHSRAKPSLSLSFFRTFPRSHKNYYVADFFGWILFSNENWWLEAATWIWKKENEWGMHSSLDIVYSCRSINRAIVVRHFLYVSFSLFNIFLSGFIDS